MLSPISRDDGDSQDHNPRKSIEQDLGPWIVRWRHRKRVWCLHFYVQVVVFGEDHHMCGIDSVVGVSTYRDEVFAWRG